MLKYELKHPNGYVLGVACKKADGWRFYPKVSGRSPSTNARPTADKSLPAWARKYLNAGCSFLPPGEC